MQSFTFVIIKWAIFLLLWPEFVIYLLIFVDRNQSLQIHHVSKEGHSWAIKSAQISP